MENRNKILVASIQSRQPGNGNRTTDLEDDDADEILDDYETFLLNKI
jgi:hypothetical protein